MLHMRSLTILATAALAALVAGPAGVRAAVEVPKYYCETDADCAAKFPDTVCISVDNYGDIVKKCTPNTKDRPACRGGQPGLCPSYQSPEISYLNAHCVFVAKDSTEKMSAASSGSGSGATTRFLMSMEDMASSKATVTTVKASSGSGAGAKAVGDGSASSSGTVTTTGTNLGTYAKVTIGKKVVIGEFICIDVSDCENKAYDTSTCDVATCGSPASKTQCNNHGTCTYKSIQTMTKRSCMCYKGFQGDKCQQEVSSECDVDCGMGGDCVDGECACKKGWDGKKYNNKQGKSDSRCTKCTNDLACENSNSCNIETGVCNCGAGYTGLTCGGVEDACVKKTCGTLGKCQPKDDNTAVCMCPICDPECTVCPTKDCSTCPSAASSLTISIGALLVAAIAALVMS